MYEGYVRNSQLIQRFRGVISISFACSALAPRWSTDCARRRNSVMYHGSMTAEGKGMGFSLGVRLGRIPVRGLFVCKVRHDEK